MVTDEHKNRLIEKIKSIHDKDIIDEIYRLLKVDFDDPVYVTNEKQKAEIAEARKQIEKGEGIDSEEVFKNVRKWLKK
ncbi:hypothetical protein [Cyclobacterium qasimii]|jgi:predicted transcriptional regulator|uniref:Uncharacterized protein n=2 Tax=Cyclobacterium qasimii TaxID=1350429 RepID=S7VL12_9BACT|nr:hypothetical protein [Cyclobacterium qasimii]EPR70875.1 hypothetical protein ADICYQ_0871 [Cyclobacterium qasimii M12-11B]GEO23839.1 hypothetical protein CQA01_43730 [Cyclobacterium qasimii]|tara:strand:+ start:1136 stop:1369 length:234 start_codon:yes stop_codon:yes gene_type:complete